MGDATEKYFLAVFEETLTILHDHDIEHLVIGSIANSAHLGSRWDSASDIDVLVTKAGADRCLEIFPRYGYAQHVRDTYWIYKMAKPNVTIDLIFKASGRVELDDQMLDAATELSFEDLKVRAPAPEDMALLFILLDTDERQGYWYDAMKYLRIVEDWDYLLNRAERYGPRKVLSALLYAAESHIPIPDRAIEVLLGLSEMPALVKDADAAS
jgi:hypothetical protein